MLSHGCLSQRLILGDLCATFVVLSLSPEGLGVCRLTLCRSPLWVRLVGFGRLGPAPMASWLVCPRRVGAPGTACPSRLLVKPWSWPSFLLQLKGQPQRRTPTCRFGVMAPGPPPPHPPICLSGFLSWDKAFIVLFEIWQRWKSIYENSSVLRGAHS